VKELDRLERCEGAGRVGRGMKGLAGLGRCEGVGQAGRVCRV
jgi:hypothetical protein